MYIELGKFGMPAKHHETIALIYSKVNTEVYLVLILIVFIVSLIIAAGCAEL